ncbi:MAG: GNAT family N-acetyltransferase [Bacilli bacterium]|nr:GNAT family N-acetyltransferase [Bacilli bacterium]
MEFVKSKEMKINLTLAQSKMLSTKEDIKIIIKDNPTTVKAFDIYDNKELIGFVLVYEFEEKKYFLWEYAIDISCQNQGRGTKALIEFIDYMKDSFGATELTTTYVYGNEVAKHVYEKVGFIETSVVDEPDCHEVNMVYHINKEKVCLR